MKYRVEVTKKDGTQSISSNMDRGAVRDEVDSVLFVTRSRIESIYIRFVDGTRVVVIEE